MSVLTAVFVLLVVYQIKHFLADYPMQGQFMLGKFSPRKIIWIPALTAHAGIHALLTLNIAMGFPYLIGKINFDVQLAIALALLDFVIHFTMDRIKASPNILGRFKAISADKYKDLNHIATMPGDHPEIVSARRFASKLLAEKMQSNQYFWWSLGVDQMVHHLTHYWIIYYLILAYVQ